MVIATINNSDSKLQVYFPGKLKHVITRSSGGSIVRGRAINKAVLSRLSKSLQGASDSFLWGELMSRCE